MSNWLLALVGCVYLWVAFDFFTRDNHGMALAFVCYAGANAGFIWATR